MLRKFEVSARLIDSIKLNQNHTVKYNKGKQERRRRGRGRRRRRRRRGGRRRKRGRGRRRRGRRRRRLPFFYYNKLRKVEFDIYSLFTTNRT